MKVQLIRWIAYSGFLAMSTTAGAASTEPHAGNTRNSDAQALQAALPAPEIGAPSDFPGVTLKGWKRRDFAGKTHYELVNEGDLRVLKGSTNGTATLLYRKKKIDLTDTPWMQWSWKVDSVFAGLDEQSRAGDDYPARLYVVARTGFLPWETYALNYVWSSSAVIDTLWLNPFTDQSAMIAVQSGDSKVGQWTMQRRNIAQDFERAFGKKIKKINGFAVMVDGDNSGSSATAWFGNIDFLEQ